MNPIQSVADTAGAALNTMRLVAAVLATGAALWCWQKKEHGKAAVLGAVAVALWLWQPGKGFGLGFGDGAGLVGAGTATPTTPADQQNTAPPQIGGLGDAIQIPITFDPTGWWVVLPSGAMLAPHVAAASIAAAFPGQEVAVTITSEARRAASVGAINYLWAFLRLVGVRFGFVPPSGSDDALLVAQAYLTGAPISRGDHYDAANLLQLYVSKYGENPNPTTPKRIHNKSTAGMVDALSRAQGQAWLY